MSSTFTRLEGMPHSPLVALRRAIDAGSGGYFEDRSGRLGFEDLDRESNRFANYLASFGVGRGDRVAALLHNSLDNIVAWFGASKCGAIWAPTNTAHAGEWLRHQITDCDPKVVILENEFIPAFRAAGLAQQVIVRGGPQDTYSLYAQAPDTATGYEPAPSDLSHLIYTSGTTGRSKGCMASHNYMVNYARLVQQANPRDASDVLWSPSPLFHLAALGYVTQNLLIGGKFHTAPSFSVSRFWHDVEAAGATVVQMLGIGPNLIAKAPDNEVSLRYRGKLKTFTGSFDPEIQQLIQERFGIRRTRVCAFGQSEGAFITLLSDQPYRDGTCGLPSDSFEVRVVDENDRQLTRGETGEIVFRPLHADVMCAGYWRNPEATAAKMRNLWWHTGDFGCQDEDGYLFFKDRGDDRLRRSGENVSSLELEAEFAKHDAISIAAAYAVPSSLGDDDIVLAIVLREGAELTGPQLLEWATGRVPRFAIPRYFHFTSELPRNPTGKVMKYVLRRAGVPEGAWDARARRDIVINQEKAQ